MEHTATTEIEHRLKKIQPTQVNGIQHSPDVLMLKRLASRFTSVVCK